MEIQSRGDDRAAGSVVTAIGTVCVGNTAGCRAVAEISPVIPETGADPELPHPLHGRTRVRTPELTAQAYRLGMDLGIVMRIDDGIGIPLHCFHHLVLRSPQRVA